MFHLHVHLIPRYAGDVPDPTGGVRNVIPAKGNYLLQHAQHGNLIRSGQDPLLPRLLSDLDRDKSAPDPGGFLAHVRHANGRPIIFLPDRNQHEGIPFGETPPTVDGTEYEARFVKVALNVVTTPGSDRNVLSQLLRTWFGPDAGLPGTNHTVRFSPTEVGWEMTPAREQRERQLELWKAYSREEIPGFFGLEFNQGKWNQGFITIPGNIFLLVTLNKDDIQADHRYTEHFESGDTFVWQSQNQTK